MKRRILISTVVAIALTALILKALISPETLSALEEAAKTANRPLLLLALALSFGMQLLRAARFRITAFDEFGIIPQRRLIGIALQINAFNFIFPFRLGELGFPVLMRQAYGLDMVKATGILVLVRVLDLLMVAALLCLGAALCGIAAPVPFGTTGLLVLAALFFLGPLPLLALGGLMAGHLYRVPYIGRFLEKMAYGVTVLGSAKARLATLISTFAIWGGFSLLAICVTSAVSTAVPPAAALMAGAANNVAFALPVNGVAGLGAAQAAWVQALRLAGIDFEPAVVTALAVHAVVLGSALLFGLPAAARYWLKRKG